MARRVRMPPHGRIHHHHGARRPRISGLARGSTRPAAGRAARDPGDLRRQQSHPRADRPVCRRRLHRHRAISVRSGAPRDRARLHAGGHAGRLGLRETTGPGGDPARSRRGACGGEALRACRGGRLLLGRLARLPRRRATAARLRGGLLRAGGELSGPEAALPGDVSLRHRGQEHPAPGRRAHPRRVPAGARVHLRRCRSRLQLRAARQLRPAGGGARPQPYARVLRPLCRRPRRRRPATPGGACSMKLRDPDLLRTRAFIGGRWLDAANGATQPVVNPATREPIGTVPDMGVAETRHAIEAASQSFPAWAALTARERAAILRRWYELLMANQEDLATLMTAEQGKPLSEAKGEISYGASFIEWFAEEGKRLYGDVIPTNQSDRRLLVLRQPVGVVAAITPWNFPLAMITRKAGPALAAGCTFVCKPAHQTPYSAIAAAALAARAGVPAGALNVVTGMHAAPIGEEMTSNPAVRKVTFTGSTAIGKKLLAQSASTVKKVSMELGGNAQFIVFDDADLDAAVAGAIASKYRNTGQTCVCANRILVQAGVYSAFAAKLAAAVSALRVGPAASGEVDQGPLINARALEKVEDHI